MCGILPFSSIKLCTYDLLRRRANGGADAETAQLPPAASASFGAVSGVTAATICFPIEVVRRRQMMGMYLGASPLGALRALIREEGSRALVAGIRINTVKVALSNAAGFFLYELFKDVLEVDGRASPLAKLRAAVAA